jgi:probable F420-dependent oxidoreductase
MKSPRTSPRRIRVGAQLWPAGTHSYATLRQAVSDVEAMGADVIFGCDHVHAPSAESGATSFEAWTTLAAWGEMTTRAEIGLLVTGMDYRNPDLLADMARSVDHISGGRLILGLRARRYEKAYTTYGYDSAPPPFRALVEGLARIEDRLARLLPPPLREIPILIDGSGDTKTLLLIAGFADIWHSAGPIDEFRRRDDMLKRYVAAARRDDSAIERAVWWRGPSEADLYRKDGATLFTAELKPGENGYDLTSLADLVAWRDGV